MKILKFRAWSIDDGKWCSRVDYDGYKEKWTGIVEVNSPIEKDKYIGEYAVEQEEIIIEPSTGLKDINGNEIYVGDIVKAKIQGLWETGPHTVARGKAIWNLEVIYNDIRYMNVFHVLGSKNQPDRIYYLFDEAISDIEVIGNIHENPELIGGD